MASYISFESAKRAVQEYTMSISKYPHVFEKSYMEVGEILGFAKSDTFTLYSTGMQ